MIMQFTSEFSELVRAQIPEEFILGDLYDVCVMMLMGGEL